MTAEQSNLQRLQGEGFTIKTPLPARYEQVLEALTEDEVNLLISIKERFERAQGLTPPEVGSYAAYLAPPPF